MRMQANCPLDEPPVPGNQYSRGDRDEAATAIVKCTSCHGACCQAETCRIPLKGVAVRPLPASTLHRIAHDRAELTSACIESRLAVFSSAMYEIPLLILLNIGSTDSSSHNLWCRVAGGRGGKFLAWGCTVACITCYHFVSHVRQVHSDTPQQIITMCSLRSKHGRRPHLLV